MNRRGQGFVELLIAIAVLMVSAVATVTLIFATLTAAEVSKSQVLAVNLGREGIEVVRALRDTNWLRADAGETVGGDTVRFDDGLSAVDGAAPPNHDYSAIARFDASANAWSLDFASANESDFSLRSDATALWFDPCDGGSSSDTCGVYSQGTGLLTSFQRINYWRLLTLYPICWKTTDANPENTEIVLREEGTGTCDTDYEVVGIEVHSRMQWMEKGRLHSFELVDKLFDWKV